MMSMLGDMLRIKAACRRDLCISRKSEEPCQVRSGAASGTLIVQQEPWRHSTRAFGHFLRILAVDRAISYTDLSPTFFYTMAPGSPTCSGFDRYYLNKVL